MLVDTDSLGRDGITGLVCFNDRVALGVLDGLRRNGLDVPCDVSVVGYDDSPVARLATVALTSVSQATEPMAVAAVEAATQRLDEGRADAVDIVLEPHLEVRGTTGPAPGDQPAATAPRPQSSERSVPHSPASPVAPRPPTTVE